MLFGLHEKQDPYASAEDEPRSRLGPPMVSAGQQRATYQDVLDAPEGMIAELIHGELRLQPRPAPRHSRAASVLGALVLPPFQLSVGGPGGWEIVDEPEIHFGPDVLVPDLAGWRLVVGDPYHNLSTAYFTMVPQWICEVLSRSTAKKDREEKLPIYARAGVAHAWLIEPTAQTIEVFALRGGELCLQHTHEGDGSFQAAPFEALTIPTGKLWLTEKGTSRPAD